LIARTEDVRRDGPTPSEGSFCISLVLLLQNNDRHGIVAFVCHRKVDGAAAMALELAARVAFEAKGGAAAAVVDHGDFYEGKVGEACAEGLAEGFFCGEARGEGEGHALVAQLGGLDLQRMKNRFRIAGLSTQRRIRST